MKFVLELSHPVIRVPMDEILRNDDGTVNTPLGRAVERYLNTLPLLSTVKLNVVETVNRGLIALKRVSGAFDYLEWTTKVTNQQITEAGRQRAEAARNGEGRDLSVWRFKYRK